MVCSLETKCVVCQINSNTLRHFRMILKIREKQCAGGATKKELGESLKKKKKIPDMESCNYNNECLSKKCDGPKNKLTGKCIKGCKCDCDVNGQCGAMQKLYLQPDRCQRCGISSCNFPSKGATKEMKQKAKKKKLLAALKKRFALGGFGRRLLSPGAHTHDGMHAAGNARTNIINVKAPGMPHAGPKPKLPTRKQIRRYQKLPKVRKVQSKSCREPKYDTQSCAVKYTMAGSMEPPMAYRTNQYTYTLCTELFQMMSALENERMLNKVNNKCLFVSCCVSIAVRVSGSRSSSKEIRVQTSWTWQEQIIPW